MKEVFLLLGSNIGDSISQLENAIAEIDLKLGPVGRRSSFYKTRAWGRMDQPDFINVAVFFKSDKTAQEILRTTQGIEEKLGRRRTEKWAARTIDIDILFYGDDVINDPDLIIPHPYFQRRRFAVEPMLELAPDFVHPGLNKSISELYSDLEDHLEVTKL